MACFVHSNHIILFRKNFWVKLYKSDFFQNYLQVNYWMFYAMFLLNIGTSPSNLFLTVLEEIREEK